MIIPTYPRQDGHSIPGSDHRAAGGLPAATATAPFAPRPPAGRPLTTRTTGTTRRTASARTKRRGRAYLSPPTPAHPAVQSPSGAS